MTVAVVGVAVATILVVIVTTLLVTEVRFAYHQTLAFATTVPRAPSSERRRRVASGTNVIVVILSIAFVARDPAALFAFFVFVTAAAAAGADATRGDGARPRRRATPRF